MSSSFQSHRDSSDQASNHKKVLRALVLAGDGINCQEETAAAARDGGFEPQIVHINDLLQDPGQLREIHMLALPGGFSFGDELGSGKILALKLKHGLKGELQSYLDRGGAVIGICNGFQVLMRLGVFGPRVSLAHNAQGSFLNRWVGLEVTGRSLFTDGFLVSGVKRLELPIRHGEGRLVFNDEKEARQALDYGRCVLRYTEDVNGSWQQVAALSAYGGRVLGLMPHPEAFWSAELHPWGSSRPVPLGTSLFANAAHALNEQIELEEEN